jgi:hypothetical protein
MAGGETPPVVLDQDSQRAPYATTLEEPARSVNRALLWSLVERTPISPAAERHGGV